MADIRHKSRRYEFDKFRVDEEEGLLWRAGEIVPLTPKAFEMLLLLIENHGHVVKKEELMARVWPDTFVEEANLTNNISLLRKVLQEKGDEQLYIKTVPRRGYRFVASVRELTGQTAEPTQRKTPLARHESDVGRPNDQARVNVSDFLPQLGWRGGTLVLALAGAVALAGFGISKWREQNTGSARLPEIKSLAVLPLVNISGDSAQDYFADGMTDALISELVQIGSLRVISRNSIMNYKGARKRTPEIGRELKVDALIEGAVVTSGERVRITINLIQTAVDHQLWSKSYERDLRDILSLQSEIGRDVAQQIRIKLTPQEQQRLSRTRKIDPAAHEAYLKGIYWLHQGIDEPHLEAEERFHKRSVEYLEEAIKLDPNYALAHAALASTYHFLATSGFPQFYSKAKDSALKALTLDDSLAQAHGALAYSIWRHEWNFAEAEKEFKRAEELEPNTYLWGYAQFLSTIGRHEEALHKYRLAQDLDPLTVFLQISAGWAYLDARQYDRAITQFQNVLELDPKQLTAHSGLCSAYLFKGRYEEGIAECQKALTLSGVARHKADLAWAYALSGRHSQANKILDELKNSSQKKSISHLDFAAIYCAIGNKEMALAHLEKAYEVREEEFLWLKVNPMFESLHSEPRFQTLLRRVGLPQ